MRDLVDLFKVLGDPTRLKLLKLVSDAELCNCELVEVLQISQSAVSQHIAKLRQAGLVREQRRGQWIYYSADPERLKAVSALWNAFLAFPTESIKEMHLEHERRQTLKRAEMCRD